MNTEAEFWNRVRRTGGCWVWTYSLDTRGYGRFDYEGRRWSAHRLAYTLAIGPIPSGMDLDHTCHSYDPTCRGGIGCRHRACVNPDHLEPVDSKTNALRGRSFSAANAEKAECPSGHAYDEANTYINPSGARVCRACRNLRYAARKAAAA